MHEFELGVWKATFTHLIRILIAEGKSTVLELNRRSIFFIQKYRTEILIVIIITYRFREVPTFGRDTIRRFSSNAAAMKKLAARDFEDLLQVSLHEITSPRPVLTMTWQCSIPVFESLLPSPHNELVLDLLYSLTEWHAFAKLRMHTDESLELFDAATATLGTVMRKFMRKTCEDYNTQELPSETAARGRRKAKRASKVAAVATRATTSTIFGVEGTSQAATTSQIITPTTTTSQLATTPVAASQSLATAISQVAEATPHQEALPAEAPQTITTLLQEPPVSTDTTSQTAEKRKRSPAPKKRKKFFNLSTYTYHALGDYANTIRQFGTTDSYSTQLVRAQSHNLRLRKTNYTIRESLSTDVLSGITAASTDVIPHARLQTSNDANVF